MPDRSKAPDPCRPAYSIRTERDWGLIARVAIAVVGAASGAQGRGYSYARPGTPSGTRAVRRASQDEPYPDHGQPMDYATLKTIHVASVAVSLSLFALRGAWMLAGSERLRHRWVRVLPHVVDTVLLASAVAMTVIARLDPAHHPWLLAKIAALVLYVVLGSVALKRGRTRATRIAALVAALAVFGYIVAVALTKNPLPV